MNTKQENNLVIIVLVVVGLIVYFGWNSFNSENDIDVAKASMENRKNTICETTGYVVKKHYLFGMEGLRKSRLCEFADTSTFEGVMTVMGSVSHKNANRPLKYTAKVYYTPRTDSIRVEDVEFGEGYTRFIKQASGYLQSNK